MVARVLEASGCGTGLVTGEAPGVLPVFVLLDLQKSKGPVPERVAATVSKFTESPLVVFDSGGLSPASVGSLLEAGAMACIPGQPGSDQWTRILISLVRGQTRQVEAVRGQPWQAENGQALNVAVLARLRMISNTARSIVGRKGLEEAGSRILESFADHLSAAGGSLFVPQGNAMVLVHTLDVSQPVPRLLPLPLPDNTIFGQVLKERKSLLGGGPFSCEQRRSGWEGYQDDSFLVTPLFRESGEIVGLVSLHNKKSPPFTLEDREVGAILASLVSESIRTSHALEALRESEERYRVLVEHATDGILLQVSGRYVYANKAILDMLGYGEKEFYALKLTDIMPDTPLGREYILKMYRDRMAGRPVPSRYEAQYRKKSGEVLDVMLSVSRIRVSGQDGVAVIVTDIAERKRAEEERHRLELQLLQAQKLESVGRLAGGVAHDFNNMLSAILGYSEMCLLEMDDDHPVKEKLKTIRRAGQKAAALTRQLLAFSRKQVLEMKVTDLNFLIENLGRMLGRMIGEDIVLDIQPAPDRCSVLADTGQIEQVLMNLAVNARDAMPRGGSLTIETERVGIPPEEKPHGDEVKPGTYVLITVTDTGEGIDAQHVDKVFEPFFTTKEVGEGTGLGLATAYGIIKQHDGFIFVSSRKGHGTSFRIYLPAVQTLAHSPVEPGPGPMFTGSETVLVVDDEISIRRLAADVLTPLGYRVISAGSGEEALGLVAAGGEKVDVLLTDVVMPGMGGRELADLFRKQVPKAQVVFMSGYMESHMDREYFAQPDVVLIRKPVTGSVLTSIIRKVLEAV